MRHVTLTTPTYGTVGHLKVSSLVLLVAKHCTKFEVFSSSEDISWGVSFKIGHVTLTTPPSGTVVVRRLTLDIGYNHII